MKQFFIALATIVLVTYLLLPAPAQPETMSGSKTPEPCWKRLEPAR